MSKVLVAAGGYNVIWGALVVLFPGEWFRLAGMAPPNYPELWQWVGLATGAYGVAYLLASTDPLRHWPVVAAGLAAKMLTPAAFLSGAMRGHLPWIAGLTIAAGDLIWWAPFGAILYRTYQHDLGRRRISSPEVQRMALRAKTQYGVSLEELSKLSPVLLVFLRHFGCTFCREALRDLARQRLAVEATGSRMVLVHMAEERRAESFFRKYGLENVARVSDPRRTAYKAFGLNRGGLGELLGPRVWWRGLLAGVIGGHGIGPPEGDGLQMPGVFLVFHGEVIRGYRHQSAADRPDYVKIAGCG